jgi:hypothetical protein
MQSRCRLLPQADDGRWSKMKWKRRTSLSHAETAPARRVAEVRKIYATPASAQDDARLRREWSLGRAGAERAATMLRRAYSQVGRPLQPAPNARDKRSIRSGTAFRRCRYCSANSPVIAVPAPTADDPAATADARFIVPISLVHLPRASPSTGFDAGCLV